MDGFNCCVVLRRSEAAGQLGSAVGDPVNKLFQQKGPAISRAFLLSFELDDVVSAGLVQQVRSAALAAGWGYGETLAVGVADEVDLVVPGIGEHAGVNHQLDVVDNVDLIFFF